VSEDALPTSVPAVVIGAGPGGLAAAAELKRVGVEVIVLDKADRVGASWAGHYDRLHLHTSRGLSGLPGYPIPRRYGRWVARDDVLRYLAEYARRHALDVHLGVIAQTVERTEGGWRVVTNRGTVEAGTVVVATGYNHTPKLPDLPGLDTYGGKVVHSSAYRNPATLGARNVLVIGPGNSGAEIAADLAEALVSRYGDGRTGDFRVPGEFGRAVEVTKANTTLYGGDRTMFVFLADEDHRIEVPGRRGGQGLARGFFAWNSEVGDGSIGGAFFLFDYACSNRIVWGAQEYREIRVRHTSGAPDKWLDAVAPQLLAYAQSSSAPFDTMIAAAQARVLEEGEAEQLLRRKFGLMQKDYEAVAAVHEEEEGRPIETIWDLQVGVTAHARSIPYQDRRVAMERIGGRVLDLVAA